MTVTRSFPALNAFTVKIHPLDADGEPLGFSGYSAGDTVTGDIDAFLHIFEEKSVKILTSVNTLFTTSVNHELSEGDKILVRYLDGTVDGLQEVATVPTTKTFTITGLTGSFTNGLFHKVMIDDEGVTMYEVRFRVALDTEYATYTNERGAANVETTTKYIVENWYSDDSGPRLTSTELIQIVPSYGEAP